MHVKKLTPNATLPSKAYHTDAGWDLYAVIPLSTVSEGPFNTVTISENFGMDLMPNVPVCVSTGIAVAIPHGYYGRIASRSGLASKGINVCGGVVDSQYRGEVKVILLNSTNKPYTIKHGDRIAQMIVEFVNLNPIVEVDDLSFTDRGQNGFGSSGQ
jgi:dUTP pyrophosphatase